MKNTTITRGLLATAIPTIGLFAFANMAGAGHTNTVLEAELDGRNEVSTGATSNRIVGGSQRSQRGLRVRDRR